MALRRIAYLSPLPPEASGIADYSVELLAGLRHHFEIDLFSAGPAHLPPSLAGLTARPYGRFPEAHARQPYDAIVYHLGNNAEFHTEVYRLALRIPGIVVLHEFMLHHLLRGMSSPREYIEAMRYSYGEAGAGIARRLLESDHPAESWTYPLFEPVVDASLGVIVHSDATRRRVLRSRPTARIAVVPHHLSLEAMPAVTPESRRARREELGIPESALVLASFGNIAPAKRIEVALRAYARFRQRHPDSAYVLAGELSWAYTRFHELLKSELGQGVILTGRLALPRLLEVMDLCDVAINLRHPDGGETSGTCVRLLGMGKPVIVSSTGWFSDIPAGCCAPVEPGRFEEDELFEYLEALAANQHLRHDMGAAARRWARERHHLNRTLAGYVSFVENTVGEAVGGWPIVPPVGSGARSDTAGALFASIAEAAADVGIREDDRALLPEIAQALCDAGLIGRRSAETVRRNQAL